MNKNEVLIWKRVPGEKKNQFGMKSCFEEQRGGALIKKESN